MTVIGVCGRKGGSGKTTTAVHLAAELASRGLSVALVDCDPQGSANHWSQPGNLPMPVHHQPLAVSADVPAWSKGIRAIQAEYLILDSPPHLDVAVGGVIGLSDIAVLPCGPSGLDLIATAETVILVREIRKARGGGNLVICLVPNRVDVRTSAGRQLEAALADLGESVAPAIHARTALADAFNLGGMGRRIRSADTRTLGSDCVGRPRFDFARAKARKEAQMTTKKNPGLGARMSTVAAALAASENLEPSTPTSRDKPVALSLRIPPPIHEELRRLAYETRTPIHAMIMEGIGMYLRTKGGRNVTTESTGV